MLFACFEGLARLSRRVWRRFVRGSREISLVPSLHRDALIHFNSWLYVNVVKGVSYNMSVFVTNGKGSSAAVSKRVIGKWLTKSTLIVNCLSLLIMQYPTVLLQTHLQVNKHITVDCTMLRNL